MIILDTNVLSELMRRAPDPAVLAWLDRQAPLSVWITAITVFECQFGLALMPLGRRRQALETSFAALLAEDLDKRVLAFDTGAAAQSATLAAQRQFGWPASGHARHPDRRHCPVPPRHVGHPQSQAL